MDADTYSSTLLDLLKKHTDEALDHLRKIYSVLPAKVSGIAIGIHPNQEPDGIFSILVHLEGQDSFSLNKVIADHRYLFDVRFVDGQLTPMVPMFDPYDSAFEVNDVIVDTSVIWLKEIWTTLEVFDDALPVTVFGADGYGTKVPVKIAVS